MKKVKKTVPYVLAIVLCAAIFRFGMVAGAASQTPGSSGDPLITQSYLELCLSEMEQAISDSYQKVSVTKGKSIMVEDGGVLIIYSGDGKVIGTKGVIDLGQGKLLSKDNQMASYHQYLSLSSDSGLSATSSCIIYVKGNYSIK